MKSFELRSFMTAQGIMPDGQILVRDGAYRHPTRRWLFETFAPAYMRNLRAAGLYGYIAQANDCEDYATRCAQTAADCHALTPGHGEAGLAVGVLYYVRTYMRTLSGIGHAIVCAVIYEQDSPVLVCLEPQNGQAVILTEEERRSCFGYTF